METAPSLPKIYCAADTTDIDRALALAAAMQRAGCGLKLGLEFFSARGSSGVREIRDAYPDLPLFLDLKFHDIPNTVAGAVRAACALAPQFINVHACGGAEMMRAAVAARDEAVSHYGVARPNLLAVTVLTSMDQAGLASVGCGLPVEEEVETLALLAKQSGMDGVVCSALEIARLRASCGADFVLMVPGIRPAGAASGDQKRVMTPPDAIRAGAHFLVIGRPITGSPDTYRAAMSIVESLAEAA